MNRKFAFGSLFVLALFISASFVSIVSAGKATDKTENSSALLSTTIVISQVYGGGGGTTGTYFNDYVELHNVSTTPQSTAGLSLMYGSATGQFASQTTNAFALPTVTLQPGQYYLVQLSAAGTGGVALPVTPDATTTNLTMSGTNGKVALVNGLTPNTCGATATPCTLPNAQIIDLVSYGTANNAEGGASVNNGAALTSVQGGVRKTNGCTETDNNNADFDVITAPVPRNTGSPVSVCGAVAPTNDALGDFNGDGKSDWTVVRNTGGGPNGQITWFEQDNGASSTIFVPFGLAGDSFVPADYDGDGKDDIAVWRPDSTLAYFYIWQSSNNTVRAEQFGITGDVPQVVGDYDGDGKADVAVFRGNGTAIDPCGVGKSTWYYRPSGTPGTNYLYDCWGKNGDFPAPGDYDGDGKNDFVVQQVSVGGAAVFQLKKSAGGVEQVYWGTPTDVIVPGDYDGDGKTDFAVTRGSAGAINWHILERDGGGTGSSPIIFGLSATDFVIPGDFDGDGKADVSVWRPSATAGVTSFFVRRSSDAGFTSFQWGQNGDYPVNNSFRF